MPYTCAHAQDDDTVPVYGNFASQVSVPPSAHFVRAQTTIPDLMHPQKAYHAAAVGLTFDSRQSALRLRSVYVRVYVCMYVYMCVCALARMVSSVQYM
jgi:hypothetical protein